MKLIQNLLSDTAIASFGWTLIHSLWQGTLIAVIAIASFYLLRRKSANLKYIVGVGFLSAQVLLSALTFIYYDFKATSAAKVGAAVTDNSAKIFHYASSTVSRAIDSKLPLSFKVQMWLSAHISELVVCWLIGAAFLLLRFAGGWIFTERLRVKANIVMDKEWRARFGVMTAKMNITQSVEFRETAKIVTPMVIGALSPVVLIPIGLLSGFSTAQVEAILAHELAHIRRNDYLINMLQSFVEVVFFFHPAIWWLSDRIRAEREHCCDDIALSVCGDKMSLAHALVKVAEWQHTPGLAMAFASKKPLLLQRVQRVLGLNPKPARTLGNLPIMLFALSLVIGISVYAVAQKSEKEKTKKSVQHATKKKQSPNKYAVRDDSIVEFDGIEPVVELADIEIPEVYVPEFDIPEFEIPDIDLSGIAAVPFMDDSTQKKMNEIHRKLQALQAEMEPYNQRIEEIELEMEKYRFDVERIQRDMEKLDWKKDGARELREDLMEKRSSLLERSRSNDAKTNESELEKQLADFEQQIKVQEQAISELNAQIASTRKETLKAEEPIRNLEKEVESLREKMEAISEKMGIESLGLARYEARSMPRPRVARVPRPAKATSIRNGQAPPPPPAPAKPAKAPAAPKPPVPNK
ncbi:M56 family metallopeptidase [Dyadobacter psychrophilus]|uniref:Signal transducer regulating beta-lactamase production, contains metallopeptidase domain n=1 Tax=Dyadobacter psychrophilus TaxID=651661 RepID=A0A1T5GSD5_9BACT|nr:M56 family metallopeptidase [Dyadobacter psychrophilus]SKC11279.1 Signal transducer regulating beta-lactamase production, contains metallopeptidase domain [Dyadobacter psychrophilus]